MLSFDKKTHLTNAVIFQIRWSTLNMLFFVLLKTCFIKIFRFCILSFLFHQLMFCDFLILGVLSVFVKGATKLYFLHYSCVVIILFNTGLQKSVFSIYSFGKLVFLSFCILCVYCANITEEINKKVLRTISVHKPFFSER